MAGNSDPIFSRVGDIGQSMLLTTAAADYTGVSPYNREIFAADATNGGYVQRIRFKSRGTNVATVARVYINNGGQNTNFTTAPAAPTGTPVTTGGTVMVGAHYGLVIAIGPGGSQSVVGAASTVVTTTTATSVINWSWTAVPGAVSYRIYVTIAGSPTGTFGNYFTSVTNSYSQTQASELGTPDDPFTGAQFLYDEVSLPATTAIATAATVTVDLPLNMALPPGYEIYVGLGTTVAAGWQVSAIGGAY